MSLSTPKSGHETPNMRQSPIKGLWMQQTPKLSEKTSPIGSPYKKRRFTLDQVIDQELLTKGNSRKETNPDSRMFFNEDVVCTSKTK